MIDEEKVRQCKNIAAQKAMNQYAQTLANMLHEAGIPFVSAVDGTSHVHSGIMFDEQQNAVALRCQWDFSADPKVIEAGIKLAKKEGAM